MDATAAHNGSSAEAVLAMQSLCDTTSCSEGRCLVSHRPAKALSQPCIFHARRCSVLRVPILPTLPIVHSVTVSLSRSPHTTALEAACLLLPEASQQG